MRIPPYLRKLVVLAGFMLVVLLTVLLSAVGLSKGIALPIAMAVTGMLSLWLGDRLSDVGVAMGIVSLLAAGGFTIYAAVKAFGGVVGGLVGTGILALAMVIPLLVVQLRRRSRSAPAAAVRR